MAVTPIKLMAVLNDAGAVREIFDIQMFLPGEVVTLGFFEKKRYFIVEHIETCPGTFQAIQVPETFDPDLQGPPTAASPTLIFDPATRHSFTAMLKAIALEPKATMTAISKRLDQVCERKGIDPDALMAMLR